MGICAGFSGGFFQVMSEAPGVTCSDHPCRPTSRWRQHSGNGRINAFPYGTLNPDAGAVIDAAGRREGHEKMVE
jgi:hypothetical protein